MNARPFPDAVCACSLISSAVSRSHGTFVLSAFGMMGLHVK